jgi:signal transduction histidine kinase
LRRGAGAGLGLAIVRQIARELGDQVHFEGGAGAFTVCVKLRASPG